MRISFISPTVGMSGGTRVIAIYAQHLVRMGHAVRIISPPAPPVALSRKIKSFLRGSGWDSPTARNSHLDGINVDHHVLDRWRPVTDDDVPDGDVVIATWWRTAEAVNALNANKGAKVYFIQGHEIFPHLPVERCRATYLLPLHKIVVARWLRKVMSTEYHDDLVDVVPNSVDRDQFFAPIRGKQAIPTVGFLYSKLPLKGLNVSFAALGVVRQSIPRLRMICFGSERPGPELPLPDNTEFALCPRQEEIRNLYAQCDVWLTASRSEGFNLTAMEAMACRTPVVSTRTGWPEEAIVPGKNGALADIDDFEELARGLQWVLSLENDDWKRVSKNAYATVTGSWEDSAKLFENALIHACHRAARGEVAGWCQTTQL